MFVVALFAVALACLLSPSLASPTAKPSANPTAHPTLKPITGTVVTSGHYVYNTMHHGVQCHTKVAEYSIDAVSLNQCLPSDLENPHTSNAVTWEQIPSPHKFTCAMQQRKFVLSSTQYAAADSTCSLQPADMKTVRHDFLCSKDASTGMYRQSHCGALPDSLALQDQLVAKSYTNSHCSADAKSRGYIFGACSRMYDPKTKQPLDKFAKLSVAMSYTQAAASTGGGNSRWAPGTVVLVVQQQIFDGEECSGAPTNTVKGEYASGPTCKADPLHPGFFYSFVARANGSGAAAVSAIPWLLDP